MKKIDFMNHKRGNTVLMGSAMQNMAKTLSAITGIINQASGQEAPITITVPKQIEGEQEVLEGRVEKPSDCEIIDVEFEDGSH